MASLRRMASLDSPLNASSNPATPHSTHLVRHSSLPNLFLCQPELAMGVQSRLSSLHKGSLYILEAPSCHSSASTHTLCRAMAHNGHSFDYDRDQISEYEIPVGVEHAHAGQVFGPLRSTACRERVSLSVNKEKALAAEYQSLDMEKSVIYSELRESMSGWEAPPSFFRPYDIGRHPHTLQEASCNASEEKRPTRLDLHNMQKSIVNDVKARPMSLRMLKRKRSKIPPEAASDKECQAGGRKTLLHNCSASEWASCCCSTTPQFIAGVGDSTFSVFTSLVYMLKMLQQYSLSSCMQTHSGISDGCTDEKCLQNWVGRAYAEMLDTFLWLFQQVFSCTPKLMILTMMLLADFTLHSVSKHVAFPVMPLGEPPTATALAYNVGERSMNMGHTHMHEEQQPVVRRQPQPEEDFPEVLLEDNKEGGGNGGGNDGATKHGTRFSDDDGFSLPLRKMTQGSRVRTVEGDDVGTRKSSIPSSSPLPSSSSSSLLQVAPVIKGVDLDATTKNMFVAPVRTPALEADNYPCFDRTDLAYQHEINMDPGNPLLLANYAQFLHVVRHDHSRAEKLYRRAVMAEAHEDGEVIARFASFLWVAKGDVAEADNAYKAAMAADPTNAYHAGCYAHFLWSSSAGSQADEASAGSIKKSLNTISGKTPKS